MAALLVGVAGDTAVVTEKFLGDGETVIIPDILPGCGDRVVCVY